MTIHIIGAGLSGLLAASQLYNASDHVVVHDTATKLPNNHSAVMRFRTPAIAKALNIPFREVELIKCVAAWRNPVADALAYAKKTNGIYRSDRSINNSNDPAARKRYIAPRDFVDKLYGRLKMQSHIRFRFGSHVGPNELRTMTENDDNIIISTIPMPEMISFLGYYQVSTAEPFDFRFSHGKNLRAIIPECDAFVSVMVPDPEYPFSRISITGDELIIEGNEQLNKFYLVAALKLLGLPEALEHSLHVSEIPQRYAKINPVEDRPRKRFIHWATVNHRVYSLGRYACWRPGLQLDDQMHDIELIKDWIRSHDNYSTALRTP